jgi:O-antigen/teichoic acid export membrane protein
MALLVSAELPMILLALVCGNGLMLLVQLLVCVRILPLERPSRPGKAEARNLVGYGAWMSATALIAPFLLLFDRLLLGSLRGPTAVAVYALAFSVLQALLLIPASLSSAMVPQVGPMKEQAEVRAFQSRCLELLNAILTPMIISAMAFSYLFFRSWIGSNLGSAVAPVAAVLLAGCWLHGIGHVASAIVIGRSRPDLLTKLLLACLLPYLALLYFATAWFGVIGAAAVWALRAAFDPVLFYWTDPSQQDLIPVGSSALLVLLAMTATLVLAWTQPIYWMIMSLLISVSLVRSRGVLMGIPKQWKGLGEGPSTQISGAASQ